MRSVLLPQALQEQIRRHAQSTYPDECCGFLIAKLPEAGTDRRIVAVEPAENHFDGERRRRFLIRPDELRTMERLLESSGRGVVGFYHSHPDHPARPSWFDQEHAFPWYTYLVIAVTAESVGELGAFELDAERSTFEQNPLRVVSPRTEATEMTPG